ncbi:unnamed protein product, partial [Darwinula stevensoni]
MMNAEVQLPPCSCFCSGLPACFMMIMVAFPPVSFPLFLFCICTVLISISEGMPERDTSIMLCVQKLRVLIEDSDQNLKYLGLLAMSKILKTHPKSVQAHKDLIMQCLDDKDESIRLRALDLLYGMVTKKNVMEIIRKLLHHMDKAEGAHYRDELLSKIIDICSQSNYTHISNFEWYVSVLVELTRVEGTQHGKLVANQMLDVAIRVPAVRSFTVAQMALLVENSHLLVRSAQRTTITEVLYAAAWICGEFAEFLPDPRGTLEAMVRMRMGSLPSHIQATFIQNILKVYSRIISRAEEEHDDETIHEVGKLVLERLPDLVSSSDLEVQERACTILTLMKQIQKLQGRGEKVAKDLAFLFAGDLNPVAPKAQRKVPVPEGLDLDAWINEPPPVESEEDEKEEDVEIFRQDAHVTGERQQPPREEPSEEELERRRQVRKDEQAHNPHYLKQTSPFRRGVNDTVGEEVPPVAKLDLNVPLHIPGMVRSDRYLNLDSTDDERKKKKKKKKKGGKKGKGKKGESSEEEEVVSPVERPEVSTQVELPEGASVSDNDEEDTRPLDDPHRALDINLDEPLKPYERLAPPAPYASLAAPEPKLADGAIRSDVTKESTKKKSKTKEEKDKKKGKKKKKKSQENGEEEKQAKEEELIPIENHVEANGLQTENLIEEDLVGVVGNHAPRVPASKEEGKEEVKEKKEKVKKKKKGKKEGKRKKKVDDIQNEVEDNGVSREEMSRKPEELHFVPSRLLLAEDSHLRLTYDTRVMPGDEHQIVVVVEFSNLDSHLARQLEWNVLDTINTKMIRGPSEADGISVPFQLPPASSVEYKYSFRVDCITVPQKLRGTLTYMLEMPDGATHKKLDFSLRFPVTAFLLTGLPPGEGEVGFARLLSGGELTAKGTVTVTEVSEEFPLVLSKLCSHLHTGLVERVDHTASLYARSIQGHHVALLVKALPGDRLTCDGKGSDQQ